MVMSAFVPLVEVNFSNRQEFCPITCTSGQPLTEGFCAKISVLMVKRVQNVSAIAKTGQV